MKKLILTALLALMTLAAQAATLTFDVTNGTSYDGLSDYANSAGNSNLILTRLDKSTASQMILTADELIGIRPKTTDSGITRARIKTMSFKLYDAYGYGYGTSTLNMTCYVQNSTETTFPKINDEEQYLPYETNFTAKLNYTFAETYCPGVIELTLTFDGDGFLYTGESILLTTFSEFENLGTDDTWWDGIYCFNPGHGSVCIGELTCPSILQGKASKQINQIPYMRFTYEEEVEKLGPTATEGDLVKGHAIGTKEYSDPGDAYYAPINPQNSQSTTQSLYLKTQLAGLTSVDATSETKANIYAITAYLEAEGYYPQSSSDIEIDVYAFNTDATSFEKVDGKEVWFDYSNSVHGHASVDWYDLMCETGYGEMPITVTFDEPFTYEGESMVLTWVATSPNYSDFTYVTYPYIYSPNDGINHTAYALNGKSSTGKIETKDGSLPYLEIDYKPLTISGGEAKTVVSFTNVKYGVAKAANNKGVDANNVYAEFDLEDASDCGSYDIYLGTKQIGHMTGKHGFVNFLTVSDKDQTLSVTPNGGANVIAGTPLTITASDLNALFEAPVVTETVETMLYGEYDITAKKVDLQGAAAVKVTTSAPISRVTFDGKQVMFKDMGGANGYQDAFEVLIPATATKPNAYNPALNNGVISFYDNNIDKTIKGIDVVRHEPQIENISKNLPLKPVAQYLFLKGATVTEDAIATASAAADTASVYRIGTNNYSVRFNAETPMEFVINGVGGSEAIEIEEDDEYLTFYHNKAESLQYRLEPTQPEEPGINALAEEETSSSYDNSHEWTTAEKGYINLNLQENKGNKVFVRTVDTKGNARLTAYREIKADGTTSGVADIEADDADDAEYFNLQGIRVSGELTPGIYIRRQGTTATKVTVK